MKKHAPSRSTEIDRLPLFKDGLIAGELRRTDRGCEIEFTTEFLARSKSSRFTYRLQALPGPQIWVGTNLPPYFAGLLPEGLRLNALARRLKTSKDDLFSLLAEAGADPVGDIHFAADSPVDSPKLPTDFQEILENYVHKAQDPTGQPLAGVQDKISSSRVSLPFVRGREHALLKFGSPEFPDLVANEDACLRLAKKCGLPVPRHRIVQDKNGVKALFVERFDRSWNKEAKLLRRYHLEDACQFLDRYPADKYRLTLQEIARGIQEICPSPEIEVLNLLRLTAFSYLIGNGDLHAKNISLLQQDALAPSRLSPAYDLVCTVIYGDETMALKMNGKNKNLKRKTFVDFGRRFGLTSGSVELMLDRLLARFAKYEDLLFSFAHARKKERSLKPMVRSRVKELSSRPR